MDRKAKSKRLQTKNQARLMKVSKNKRGKLQQWDEQGMRAVVQEYYAKKNNPQALSIKALFHAYQVPRPTLTDRPSGAPDVSIKTKIGRKNMFSVDQETELASLLIDLLK